MEKIDAFYINGKIEEYLHEVWEGRDVVELVNCQRYGISADRVQSLVNEIKESGGVTEVEGYELSSIQAIIILEKINE